MIVRKKEPAGHVMISRLLHLSLFVLLGLPAYDSAAQIAEPSSLPSQQTQVLKTYTQTLRQHLREGRYEAARERFNERMRGKLSEEKLRQTWQSLEKSLGKAKPQKQIRISRGEHSSSPEKNEGATYVAKNAIRFGNMNLELVVTYQLTDPKAKHAIKGYKVAGLFIRRATAQQRYSLPDYADSTQYTAEALALQAEEEPNLPGTLTLPASAEGPHPLVILVHGSGANDRDESIGANKPFKDLAAGLSSGGIAVYRYDKRTYATQLNKHADSITLWDVTNNDALRALRQIPGHPAIDSSRVYLLGHSLGGNQLPRIAQQAQQEQVPLKGLILMAANNEPLYNVVVRQLKYLRKHDANRSINDSLIAKAKQRAQRVRKGNFTQDTPKEELSMSMPASFWGDLRGYDPIATLTATGLPVLVLQGGRDYHVREQDFQAWKDALEDTPQKAEFQYYEELNHLMMPSDSPSLPSDYLSPGHVHLSVITDITQFIR